MGAFIGADDGARRAARKAIWDALPETVKTRKQWLGRMSPGCTATHSVYEGCDFSCTACYLAKGANRVPPLPFEQVKAQLDTIRASQGPGGNVQLTAGEVTLLPREQLARIVRYARSCELDPMLMTHGQIFDRDPTYLHHLMRAGLQKISVHIDSTQRGRDGFRKGATEPELMAVRARFAQHIRDARAITGLPLHAAHTVTATPESLEHIPMLARWTLENADAFRMFAVNPTAQVGRTRAAVGSVKVADAVHRLIQQGAGRPVPRNTFLFGHPDCTAISLMWAVRFGDRLEVMELTRDGHRLDHWFFDRLSHGALEGFNADDERPAMAVARVLGLLARRPGILAEWPAYSVARVYQERRWVGAFAKAVLRGKRWSVRPFVTIVHNFMDPSELDTPLGKERLEACAFKLAVDGEMVPMCQMNATPLRAEINAAQREALVQIRSVEP